MLRNSSAAATGISTFICGIFTRISTVGSHAPSNFRTSMLRPVVSADIFKLWLPFLSETALGASEFGSIHLPSPDANLKSTAPCEESSAASGTGSQKTPRESGFIRQTGFFTAFAQPLNEPQT